MQKRVRTVEAQKVRRNFKARVRFSETIKDGMAYWPDYIRWAFLFALLILFDMATGFRVELFYPFYLVIKAGYLAWNKNHSAVVTLANHDSMKFSVLFLCVTGTSDLICYLFIPIHWLIFFASCYVWLSLLWASYGGFLRAVAAVKGEGATSTAPLLFAAFFIICFEFFVRLRCDILVVSIGERFLSSGDGGQACEHVRGTGGFFSMHWNSLFGCHCIGYPLILVSFSLRYYVREWLIRRRESSIARRNENYYKILTEALPAVYEGPRDYSVRTPILEEECDLLGSSGLDLQPMLMAPPYCNGSSTSSRKNSSTKSSSSNGLRNRQGSRNKSGAQQSTPPQKNGATRRHDDDDDDSDGSDEWEKQSTRSSSGSMSFLRFLWSLLQWTGSIFPGGSGSSVEEDDLSDLLHDENEYKKSLRNGDINKNRAVMARKGRVREKTKEKVITAQPIERDKVCPPSSNSSSLPTMNGKSSSSAETRESSRDTSISTSTTTTAASRTSMSLEVERLKSDIQQLRSAEQDSKLQLAAARNTEAVLRNEAASLKANLERAEQKTRAVEKMRDADRINMAQLEKKYAELLNKKNDVERELMAERKARKEDGGKKSDNTEQLRERERELENTVEKLRSDSVVREERLQQLEDELHELKKYKEGNESGAAEKDDEIKQLKARLTDLELALQSENKLKQDLFRCLGEARAIQNMLQAKVGKLESGPEEAGAPLSVSVNSSVSASEKASPSQQIPQSSPPSYNMAMQLPKCPCPDTHMGPAYLYTALQQHHSSPTGEHHLFEQSSSPSLLSPMLSPVDPLLTGRLNKFGAPTSPIGAPPATNGPTRIN